jgi:8-oxo-dGTP diphosphatase
MIMPTHIVAVAGYVEDEKGNVLLVKTIHNGWVFPGGQVEAGENLIDALVRETKEESGIDITVSHLSGVYSNTAQYTWHDGVTNVPTKVMFDFVCKPVGGDLAVSDETTDSRWVPKEDVLCMLTGEAYLTRFSDYLKNEGKVIYKEYVTKPNFELKVERSV